MKIGILTFHQTPNYGAMLQAYALWKVLMKAGHQVEIIDYRPIGLSLENLRCMIWSKRPMARIVQFLTMKDSMKRIATVGKKIYRTCRQLKKASDKYDLVVAGSDEIWNFEKRFNDFNPSYFLDFVNDERTLKASYATSFGTVSCLNGFKKSVHDLLARFDFISVRDHHSVSLVKSVGHAVTEVLDPTFLMDYSELEMPSLIARPYLLLYSYKISEEERLFVRNLAKAKGLLIVSAGNADPCADRNWVDVSVEEWVTLFKHASYVVTSYFHGTILSILYRKPFNALTKPKKTIKINDLLDKTMLGGRIFNASRHDNQTLDIDYEDVYKRLSPWLATSRGYLKTVLDSLGSTSGQGT